MKKLLFIICFLWSVVYGQTIGYLRYDSVKIYKNGGTSELILENATKGVTGGVLVNTWDGRTAFTLTPSISIPISSLTAATGANTINNVAYNQLWQWNSLSAANGLSLSSSSTLGASNSQILLSVGLSGANSNSNQLTRAAFFENNHTGTGSTNIAAEFSVNGGATNIAGRFIADGSTKYAIQLQDGTESNGYILSSDGTGRAHWTNPTSIVTATPTLQQVTTAGNTTTDDITFSSAYPSRNSLTWTSNGGTDYGQLTYAGNTGNYTWTLPNANGIIPISVNGNAANSYGAIVISSGAGSGTVTGTGTANRGTYWDGTSSITSSANYLFDGTTMTLAANGAASTPIFKGTGTWFTGGSATTTKPYLLIEPTGTTSTAWSTAGTGLGINAASGFVGNLIDAQLNGVTKFYVNQLGVANVSAINAYNAATATTIQANGVAAGGILISSGQNFSWDANATLTGSADLTLSRKAAGILQVGTTAANFAGSIMATTFIGGSATTSPITYKTTTGVGTTGADHIWQVGNNGATEAMRILNNGNVGIGTSSPASVGLLDLTSTTKGFLPPRMTTAQRTAITAIEGLIIYDTDLHKLYVYDGTTWQACW